MSEGRCGLTGYSRTVEAVVHDGRGATTAKKVVSCI